MVYFRPPELAGMDICTLPYRTVTFSMMSLSLQVWV